MTFTLGYGDVALCICIRMTWLIAPVERPWILDDLRNLNAGYAVVHGNVEGFIE
jgi:hypothetical protein